MAHGTAISKPPLIDSLQTECYAEPFDFCRMREGRWMHVKPRHFAFGGIVALLLLGLLTLFQSPEPRLVSRVPQDIPLSQLLTDVDQGRIREVVFQGQEIYGTYADGHRFNTYAPNDPTLLQRLYGKEGVVITARPARDDVPWFISLIISWLPFLCLVALWFGIGRSISRTIDRALRTPDGRALSQVVDEELRKSNQRLEQLLNNRRAASEQP